MKALSVVHGLFVCGVLYADFCVRFFVRGFFGADFGADFWCGFFGAEF